jgi:hypothetical protein
MKYGHDYYAKAVAEQRRWIEVCERDPHSSYHGQEAVYVKRADLEELKRLEARLAEHPKRAWARCTRCRKRKAEAGRSLCWDCRHDDIRSEARAVVATGLCPRCGARLRRNGALAGWYQCEQYGADGFRKDSSKPACSFQTFTE